MHFLPTITFPMLKKNYVVLPLCIANDWNQVFCQQPFDKVSRNTVTGSRVDHIMHLLIKKGLFCTSKIFILFESLPSTLYNFSLMYVHRIIGFIIYFYKRSALYMLPNKFCLSDHNCPIKWSCFIEPGLDGSGKNQKPCFFLLGLKYTLRTCFESKKFFF